MLNRRSLLLGSLGVAVSSAESRRVVARDTKFSAERFAAKGDGRTDDAQALRTLFAAAAAERGEVILPPGNYLVTTPSRDPTRMFSIANAEGLVISGVLGKTKITLAKGSNANVFFFDRCGGVTLRGVEIDGNGASQKTGSLVSFTDCRRPIVTQCDLHHAARNCLVFDDDCRDLQVFDNDIHETLPTPIKGQTSHGISLSGDVTDGTGKRCIGGNIYKNRIWDCADSGINASECEAVSIYENDVWYTGSHDSGYGGIRTTNGARRLKVYRNKILRTDRGIFISQTGDSEFSENVIEDTRRDGIYVVNGYDTPNSIRPYRNRIVRNTIRNPGRNTGSPERAAIRLRGVVDTEVADNVIVNEVGRMPEAIAEVNGRSQRSERNRVSGNRESKGLSK